MDQLTFLSGERPAKASASQAFEKDWLTLAVTWPSTFLKFLTSNAPAGWFGRTSPASFRLPASMPVSNPETLEPSLPAFGNAGMGSPTEFLTLNISEYPSDAVVCSLSDILETGDLPQRYFLSAKACRGILRRAEKRGKDLPPMLARALEQVAVDLKEPAKPEAKTL